MHQQVVFITSSQKEYVKVKANEMKCKIPEPILVENVQRYQRGRKYKKVLLDYIDYVDDVVWKQGFLL